MQTPYGTIQFDFRREKHLLKNNANKKMLLLIKKMLTNIEWDRTSTKSSINADTVFSN